MQVYVLIAHQREDSFCHGITDTAIETLKAAGHTVVYHDLYKEGFEPILEDGEIPPDVELPPEIEQHVEEILASDGVIVVHPNWWASPPAILKGWLDRVLRVKRMYQFGPNGVEGLLGDKTAVVLTTSNTPREVELKVYGDPLENFWKKCVWGFCGVKEENFERRNFESVVMSTPEERAGWLDDVREIVGRRFPS